MPLYNCGSEKLAIEIHNIDHLMQFLMGLNDVFDQVCSQILLLDPLPTANKAFLMVPRVESQKEVQTNISEHTEVTALAVRLQGKKREYQKYEEQKGHCNYCNLDGNMQAGYFKLISYLEWFKNTNRNFSNPGPSKSRYTAHISHADGHNVGIYGITAG